MKIKTSELKGAALDWAVAVSCNMNPEIQAGYVCTHQVKGWPALIFDPSTNWDRGGPLIDQSARLQLKKWLESASSSRCEAHIHDYNSDAVAFGPTLLVAAMRCIVMAKLGEEVEIPDELCDESK